jgi:hypothetical protein
MVSGKIQRTDNTQFLGPGPRLMSCLDMYNERPFITLIEAFFAIEPKNISLRLPGNVIFFQT